MIQYIELIITYMAFWSCGIVFSYVFEPRKEFKRNATVFAIIISGLLVILLMISGNANFMIEVITKNVLNVLMFFCIYYCWEMAVTTAIYNTVWAISLWQLLYEVWTLSKLWLQGFFDCNPVWQILAMLILYVGGHVICAVTIAKWMPADRKKKLGPRQTVSAILIFSIIEILAYAPALQSVDTYNSDWKFIYLSQMMCIIILYLQNELFKKSDIKQELAIMNLLWKKEQEQYKLTTDNIALINQRSHDLKHQIKALRHASREEFDKYLDEMEDSVLIYDAIVKTGNEVLDTILTEKSLYCKDKGIQVSCVADGSQMSFINTVDLYALLGNALDNAIEAVEKFEEIEKRQIDVIVYRQQNFLVINVINPISEELVYDEEELPITTKGDKKLHGFGLRSMRHIVWKYDGFLNINEEDGCFSMKVLMPIPSEK